jgi:hypothetical protein
MEMLDGAPWIKSETDVEIQKIVERSEKQSPNAYKYDYLPRVIFVPNDDFVLGVKRNGHDHFYEWNYNTQWKSSAGARSTSLYVYTKSFLCHREGHVRRGGSSTIKPSAVHPEDSVEPPKVKRSRTVYNPTCKADCKAKLIVHKLRDDFLTGQH